MAGQMKGIEKVKYFTKEAQTRTANLYITYFYNRVVYKGFDAKGKRVPSYSESYQKYRKKHGRNVNRDFFVLSSLTMKDFKSGCKGVGNDYFDIGWNDRGDISQYLAEKGRDIISDLPDKDKEFILKKLADEAEGEWKKKIKNMTINVGR